MFSGCAFLAQPATQTTLALTLTDNTPAVAVANLQYLYSYCTPTAAPACKLKGTCHFSTTVV